MNNRKLYSTGETVSKSSFTDGVIRQNVVLMSGLLTGPVVAGATNFNNALVISIGFALITFITVFICRFIPRKIVYALRITIYSVIASIIYIPVVILLEKMFDVHIVTAAGIYLPVLVTNPLILSKTQTRFYLQNMRSMITEVLGYIVGFDLVCLFVGLLRDILVNNRISWIGVDIGFTIPALETTFGGFFIVGALAGLVRALYNRHRAYVLRKNDIDDTIVHEI